MKIYKTESEYNLNMLLNSFSKNRDDTLRLRSDKIEIATKLHT